MQLALLGAGHLVGLAVGLAMFIGLLLAWAVFVPVMTAMQGTEGLAEEAAGAVWGGQVRRIGAGAIAISGALANPSPPAALVLEPSLQAASARTSATAVPARVIVRNICVPPSGYTRSLTQVSRPKQGV
jgi:uncharacterized oligopeptide transporter (OPT) family protein